GPIYLNVALEHMLHEWTPPSAAREVPPAPTVQPRPADVERVAELLRNCKSPVIVTETAGRDPDAFSALVELADLLPIAVIHRRGEEREDRCRDGERAATAPRARARELCGGPASGAGKSRERRRHRSARALRRARQRHARGYDLCGRDHHAFTAAAPAPPAHHAAKLLPRLRRARPGDRHPPGHQDRG